MKKKLLFCSYDLCVGGIEKSLINLLKQINYDKYDVTLILEHINGIYLNKLPKEVSLKEYKVSDSNIILFRKIYNFIKRIVWQISNKNKYDFSCCYATYSLPCNFLSRIASKNNCLYVHSNYYEAFNKDLSKTQEFFKKRNINNFKKIVFVSNEAKNDLIKLIPQINKRSIVINNLTDYKEILKLSKELIDELKPKTDKLFLFVGRLDNESKNFKRMMKSFSIVKEGFKLWIIGDGKDKVLIEDLIKRYNLNDKVELLGKKLNPYPYFLKADYIILTSNYEGFPVVYNEAILLNKPIISTIDVSDDYISITNRFGYIISKNENNIANIIQKCIETQFTSETLNFEKINMEKMKKLERIFDGEEYDKI